MKKNIIITGTSRGIGLELVKQFAAAGHKILALSRNEKPCLELQFENVTTISCDITLSENVNKAVDFVKSNWKRIDIVINNSGKLVNASFEKITLEMWQDLYNINVFGVVNITKAMLPFMHKNSHVVNISSMGGVQGSAKFAGLSAYSSSKGALITLTELLAEEYKETGPSFNVLALGAVQTEMLAEAFPGYQAPLTAEEMATYIMDFSLKGNKFYNGKILQVSNTTP
ncbi:MAG: short-chain dehydrogenase [Flavobacteriaceae bacterium CG_4_8_14_3_um_filter_34_10]|nr:MAG: short-chain dehydrogenase [Flavobacteriaceae bacterium CG18_big_fil_WC_8_21_14_2_50_34_36]PIV51416.1 MAG: short-chain dehydrogenase [Flavobacteriaceae bacterium CG02_land_8_20_14_3_00_34_13]PIX08329.1 MAG: short-chain dehydrogenase [Flavobacteriaceae bacterium CG_4_8_14_3_um_filter_34_10]PIZ08428.1 MAG: short-chain dehydrogenase [Flavobacteriaceae bacterium CG_4_10_14_0_8_um_filter_34_31]PJC07717.1 MAG: short-chain dehydrogenase [Flavobacteriaceae bacterium CG_4_9_14_0_8_um_filter_34_30